MKYSDIVDELVNMSIEDSVELGVYTPEEQLDYILEELRENCEKQLQQIVDPA